MSVGISEACRMESYFQNLTLFRETLSKRASIRPNLPISRTTLMKKIIIALIALVVVAGGALIVRQNLPSKRYARHLQKARLFVRERNYTAARLEYESAFNATDGF